jgi:hypothetical protein
MHRIRLICLLSSILVILAGCTSQSHPELTGVLRGTVSVGPLQPVEQAGVPTPVPQPEIFTSRGIDIYKSGSDSVFSTVNFSADRTYSLSLPAGKYDVKLKEEGSQFSKDLPASVIIKAGEVTILDISIDTGIR